MTQSSAVVDGTGSLASDDGDAGLGVTALLVVQQAREAWVDQTLKALVGQHRRPDRLVVIDATKQRSMNDRIAGDPLVQEAFPDVSVVAVPAGTPFAAVIDTAVDALPGPGENVVVARRPRRRARAHKIRPRDRHQWLWLLHEDSAPDPAALEHLTAVVGQSARIGIAGAKIVGLDAPERLVNVGITVTRSGRHVGSDVEGEPDQGQYDGRRDVLAVGSAGMLVRRDVYTRLGGFDPAFDGDGDGLDLCWRAHLTSHRVVVVPGAVCHQDRAARPAGRDAPAPGSARTLRRHRQVALARASLLGLPLMAVWIAVGGMVVAASLLLCKRTRSAAIEFAQATAPFGMVRIVAARWRFMGRSSARRRNLRSLFVPASRAMHAGLASMQDAFAPALEPATPRRDARASRGAGRRAVANPGLWMTLVLIAASLVMWRHLIDTPAFAGGGNGLAGGQLRPFSTDAAGIWHLWRDGWQGPGLGHGPVPTPYLPVLAGLTWLVQAIPGVTHASAGATTLAYLLAACMPLSGIAAYRAARTVTRARLPRAIAALAWASLATLTTAVSDGRLGPAVAHVLAPLAFAGIFQIARRRASGPSTFATVLAAALLGAFAPPLLALVTVMALVVVIIGRGCWARARGAAVAVLPWILLAPWSRAVVRDDWRALLSAPGGLTDASSAGPHPWQLALLHPGGPGSYLVLAGVPVVLAGVLGMLRPGGRIAALALVVLALLGLTGGLFAQHLHLFAAADGALAPWSGTALDVAAMALLALALLGSRPADDDAAPAAESGAAKSARAVASRYAGLVRPTAVVFAGIVSLAVTALAVWSAPVQALQPARPAFSGITDAPVHGQRAVRVLELNVAASGAISYSLQGQEPGPPVRGMPTASADDARTAAAVRTLIAPAGSGDTALAKNLHALAVYAVSVHGDPPASLRQSLQATGILTPLNGGNHTTVWRVQPLPVEGSGHSVDASRVALYAGTKPAGELPSMMAHGRTSTMVPAGPADRLVVLSEGPGWASLADASVNGHRLERAEVAGLPAYRMPAGGGHLVIDSGTAFWKLRWLQLGLLLVVVFLAVPLGRRRIRERG